LAVKKCAFALASSPGSVPISYPILGPFLAKLKQLGTATPIDLKHKFMRIQVTQSAPVQQEVVQAMLYQRYSISPEDIISFHELVNSFNRLPLVFSHPVVTKLMIDYM
jgi:hypothetical protein